MILNYSVFTKSLGFLGIMLSISVKIVLKWFNSSMATYCPNLVNTTCTNMTGFPKSRDPSLITSLKSHFSYCPLVWFFHSRTKSNKINPLHKRSIRVISNDKTLKIKKTNGTIWVYAKAQKLFADNCDWDFQRHDNIAPPLFYCDF